MARKRLIPENTRIHHGTIEFRKVHKGRTYSGHWPESQPEVAFVEIRKILNRIANNEEISPYEEGQITLSKACDYFWELHASKKPECDYFPSQLARIKDKMGHLLYHNVIDEDVKDFQTYLITTPFKNPRHKNSEPKLFANGTVNGHHKTLISVFNSVNKWVKLKKIPKIKLPEQGNPAELVKKLSEERDTRTRVGSVEEMERLIMNAHPSVKAIVQAELFLFLRKEDLKAAKLTGTSPVVAGEQGKTRLPYCVAKAGMHFTPLDWKNFEKRFQAALKKANIKDFTFRDLRRTGASWLFKETNDLRAVQDRLGHASMTTTNKYLGILDADKMKSSQVMGGFIQRLRAVSSVVEHRPHTSGATGSSPVLPTNHSQQGINSRLFGGGLGGNGPKSVNENEQNDASLEQIDQRDRAEGTILTRLRLGVGFSRRSTEAPFQKRI